MTKIDRYEKLLKLQEEEKQLRAKINDLDAMIKAFDNSRTRMDSKVEDFLYSQEEMKTQQKVLKDRQKWLIHQQDVIQKEMKKALETTRPGDKS
jgi:chromosome segregation ATPase